MPDLELRVALEKSLVHGDFLRLLDTLGYSSTLIPPNQSGDASDFIRNFPAEKPDTKSEQAFLQETKAVRILFQFSNTEITQSERNPDLDAARFDTGNIQSFLFAAVELHDNTYPRGQYVTFTRELNKRLKQPVVILFRTATKKTTLAFVRRRRHRRRPDRDVMENVSLVKEIDPANPHRAHLDILSQLSRPARIQWIEDNGKSRNFDGLLEAWLSALGTDVLNRRFYRDLFAWFNRAVTTARFPSDQAITISPKEHIIRLITRLLFIWFIKEKGLVANELFNQSQVSNLLKDYDHIGGDSYYRAILQNLFFSTLNTEISQRRFRQQRQKDHHNLSVYRYWNEIADPDRLQELFSHTPFINGGLFDCLDNGIDGNLRIDCFSDTDCHMVSIPNYLFFDESPTEPGLISLFNRYKFTVEENTPTEQEVALDPELLGKVFENLLATYNPESQLTARRETGSYYTPHAVVDYMVDETLVATLARQVSPDDNDTEFWTERLHYLLAYDDAFTDAEELFTPAERDTTIRAIAGLKILDPAIGSGAFPMGVLHKLTLALRRLDPDNRIWEQIQLEQATSLVATTPGTCDQAVHDTEINEISTTFERYRNSDYGRKLYLIQNCIYGVDIQPIAVQIAKLRFFISLAIEQELDHGTDNFGIRPLPNLETRFVAANTLWALEQPTQLPLGRIDAVTEKEQELAANRKRYFHANTQSAKQECRNNDADLRHQLAKLLQATGLPAASASQISAWDPFEQNTSAPWFDSKYMFDVTASFNIVIGNPPYISIENLSSEMRNYLFANYETCVKRTDIYIAFLEKSLSLLNSNGLMCFIIPAAFTVQQYSTKIRQQLIDSHHIREIVDASNYKIFENASVFNIVLSIAKSRSAKPTRVRLYTSNADFDNHSDREFIIDQRFFTMLKDARFDTKPALTARVAIRDKAWENSIRLDQICLVAYGARLNHRTDTRIRKADYISTTPSAGNKPFCEGRSIKRYTFSRHGWLNYQPDQHYNPMFSQLFESEKLMIRRIIKSQVQAAWDNKNFYNSDNVINCVRLDLLAEATHRTAVSAYNGANLDQAQKFDYKYLLAVLNSRFVSWYFCNFLGDDLHCNPNDVKELPIPKATSAQQRRIIKLIDRILEAKATNPPTDTSEDEAKLDQLMYQLYGLTDDEIVTVSGNMPLVA